jgi:hypothetical protein
MGIRFQTGVFGYGLDFQAGFFCCFIVFFLLFFFELRGVPGVFAQWRFGYFAGVDHDSGLELGLEVGVAEVDAGSLQGVEEQAGGFVVELVAGQQAHDLHERDLNGVGVF